MKALCSFSLVFLLGIGSLWAQLDLPRKSPKAGVTYNIGLANIKIDYSSPAVGGRSVWGSMVPYNEVWRTGANEATTIEFSTDVIIEGKYLDKGRYALFFIPKKGDEWIAVFNKTADQWGAYRYDEKLDALRVPVKVKKAENSEERLSFAIEDLAPDRGYIRFGWEKMRAYILVRVDLPAQLVNAVKEAVNKAPKEQHWLINVQAAEYFMDIPLLDKANEYANRSLESDKQCRNLWLKARLLAEEKNYPAAAEMADMALATGAQAPEDRFYNSNKDKIGAESAAWKAKARKK